MHDGERINARAQIVDYDAGALGEPLQSPDRKRLPHIEHTEEYKAREKGFPSEGNSDERDQLPSDLVDDDELGIFRAVGAGDPGGGGDSDESYDCGGEECGPDAVIRAD